MYNSVSDMLERLKLQSLKHGTNHPQLKRSMRVTRVCAACAKAKNTRGIKPLVYTRVHTSTRV